MGKMRFGISVATLGDYADPRAVVQLAQAAESSGWEGLFVSRGSFTELLARVKDGPPR